MLQNGKATIDNSFGSLSISIPSKKNWFALIFGTAWLGGWFFGFVMVSGMMLGGIGGHSAINGFMLFWLIAWTAGGLMIISLLLWGYFGQEKFLADSAEVSFDRTVFGIGWKKKLDPGYIKNFRVASLNTNWVFGNRWAFWGVGPGKIKFDYGFKTYSFGLAVDDAEANYIVEVMNGFFKKP